MTRPWTTTEIEATVAPYFEMRRHELAGLPYVKSQFNERVRRVLDSRSKAAVEFKFQNVSAVLVNYDQYYIRGYLPAQNYQRALEQAVLEWLAGEDDLAEIVEQSPVVNPPAPDSASQFSQILSPPPNPKRIARRTGAPVAVKIDFVRRDAENRKLGQQGEAFVFEVEQRRLHDEDHRPDLARKVRWRLAMMVTGWATTFCHSNPLDESA